MKTWKTAIAVFLLVLSVRLTAARQSCGCTMEKMSIDLQILSPLRPCSKESVHQSTHNDIGSKRMEAADASNRSSTNTDNLTFQFKSREEFFNC